MSEKLYNPHWYRIANIKPKLHSHLEIHRHDYRGLIWYILEDTTTGRNHRFNPAAYQFIGLFNGKRTVEEIYNTLNKQLGDFAPTQDSIIELMGQLHNAELIQTDVLIDTDELFERQTRIKENKFSEQFSNPISQKLALWDPEQFLTQHLSKVAWVFNQWVGFTWLAVIVFTIMQAATHWEKISHHFEVNSLSSNNFFVLFLLYPLIKVAHELGHAFATKYKGGEVHEMGVNFMLFMPIPYVNVSSSSNFRNKYDRILVSSIGIIVETFLASVGLLLFLNAQPGLIQDIGFNTFIIGGVSSIFFNGNPLLKYDGYYILADALGIPNLFQRSHYFWHYFFQRYLLGLRQVVSPATSHGETFWFVVYSISSTLYRLSLLWFICIYVTGKFFTLGVVLASWLVGMQIIKPLYKASQFVIASPSLSKTRASALIRTAGIALLTIGLFGFMPVNSYTLTEGVIWLPDEALIKAEQDGFIKDIKASLTQNVQQGDDILVMQDDLLESKVRVARAKLAELESKYRSERETNLVDADILKEEVRIAQSELDHLNTKVRTMTITAGKSGHLILPEADDLPGRFVHHGEILGYILDENPPNIRIVLSQDNIGQVREKISDIKVRLVNAPHVEYDAKVIRQAPEAINRLPSPALATIGGGKIPIDPKSQKELITLQKVFWTDLKFEPHTKNIPIGARVFVRINHGGEPLSIQWYRRIRQAFLRHFNV